MLTPAYIKHFFVLLQNHRKKLNKTINNLALQNTQVSEITQISIRQTVNSTFIWTINLNKLPVFSWQMSPTSSAVTRILEYMFKLRARCTKVKEKVFFFCVWMVGSAFYWALLDISISLMLSSASLTLRSRYVFFCCGENKRKDKNKSVITSGSETSEGFFCQNTPFYSPNCVTELLKFFVIR